MIFNGAYSAEKGYDLRTPYNVPMGEIRYIRTVPPFSPSTLQRDITTPKPGGCGIRKFAPPSIPRTVTSSLCSYDATYDSSCSSSSTYTLKVGQGSPTTPAVANIMRLVDKNTNTIIK